MSTPGPMLELERVETYRGPRRSSARSRSRWAPASRVCLVGRNGAGKTTTIDTIMGLLPARSGAIRFKTQDVTRLPAHQRARLGIGYAPEDCGIFPDLTVEENFQITAWLGREAAVTADDQVFSIFPEIKTFLTRRGLHLSGGQKKMLAITRALTLKPSVLLLDEPFEGLAPVVVTRFIEAVRAVKALGVSVLIAESHAERGASPTGSTPSIAARSSSPAAALLGNAEVMKTLHG